MDETPTIGPDSNIPDGASQVKKAWTPPRLTVHGTLPAMTFAASPKTAP